MRPSQYAFGRNIRILLAERQMTQQELADRMGVTKETIYNHMHGRRSVSLPSLMAYARVLDVPMSALVDPDGVRVVVKADEPASLRRAS